MALPPNYINLCYAFDHLCLYQWSLYDVAYALPLCPRVNCSGSPLLQRVADTWHWRADHHMIHSDNKRIAGRAASLPETTNELPK